MEHHYLWDKGIRFANDMVPTDKPVSAAVIRGDDWYLRSYKGIDAWRRHEIYEEVYNVADDPLQVNNLVSASQKLPGLRKLCDQRQFSDRPTSQITLDRTLENQLKSMGYLE